MCDCVDEGVVPVVSFLDYAIEREEEPGSDEDGSIDENDDEERND